MVLRLPSFFRCIFHYSKILCQPLNHPPDGERVVFFAAEHHLAGYDFVVLLECVFCCSHKGAVGPFQAKHCFES